MKLSEIRIFILKFRVGEIDFKVEEPWNTMKWLKQQHFYPGDRLSALKLFFVLCFLLLQAMKLDLKSLSPIKNCFSDTNSLPAALKIKYSFQDSLLFFVTAGQVKWSCVTNAFNASNVSIPMLQMKVCLL